MAAEATARVIDFDAFRRRREEAKRAPVATPSVAPVMWYPVLFWVPVWRY